MGILAFVVACLVMTGFVGFVCVRQYYIARRKGYNSGLAAAIVVGSALVLVVGGVFACALVEDGGRSKPAQSTDVAFLLMILLYFFVVALGVAGLVAALPRRSARRAGTRSVPFLHSRAARWLERVLAWGGGVCLALGVFNLCFSAEKNLAVKTLQIGIWLVSAPAMFAYYRKRATAPTLEVVIEEDPRPPVLYLRAFCEESEPFLWGPEGKLNKYTDAPTGQAWYIGVTFEQYLGAALARDIGPFVALGNPEDTLPPEGAARSYTEDRDWQQEFLSLAESAVAIVMVVSRSENLRWELAALRCRNWHGKLFVITPLLPKSNARAYRWLRAVARAAKGVPAPDWKEFAGELAPMGLQVDPVEPGPGLVVSFDRDGRAEVLTRGAREPEEFTHAIRARLQTLASAGSRSEAPPATAHTRISQSA